MASFTTKLSIGQKALLVTGGIDFNIREVTVGQVRVTETHPAYRSWDADPVYKEEYMVVETGIGSGNIWTYGKDLFSTREEAERGKVVKEQIAYFQRRERDEYLAKEKARQEAHERSQLADLLSKYPDATQPV